MRLKIWIFGPNLDVFDKKPYLLNETILCVLKAHLVIHHLGEYVNMEGTGIGLFLAQTGESLQSDFKNHWLYNHVKNTDFPTYAKNLYKVVVSYHNLHL